MAIKTGDGSSSTGSDSHEVFFFHMDPIRGMTLKCQWNVTYGVMWPVHWKKGALWLDGKEEIITIINCKRRRNADFGQNVFFFLSPQSGVSLDQISDSNTENFIYPCGGQIKFCFWQAEIWPKFCQNFRNIVFLPITPNGNAATLRPHKQPRKNSKTFSCCCYQDE